MNERRALDWFGWIKRFLADIHTGRIDTWYHESPEGFVEGVGPRSYSDNVKFLAATGGRICAIVHRSRTNTLIVVVTGAPGEGYYLSVQAIGHPIELFRIEDRT